MHQLVLLLLTVPAVQSTCWCISSLGLMCAGPVTFPLLGSVHHCADGKLSIVTNAEKDVIVACRAARDGITVTVRTDRCDLVQPCCHAVTSSCCEGSQAGTNAAVITSTQSTSKPEVSSSTSSGTLTTPNPPMGKGRSRVVAMFKITFEAVRDIQDPSYFYNRVEG